MTSIVLRILGAIALATILVLGIAWLWCPS